MQAGSTKRLSWLVVMVMSLTLWAPVEGAAQGRGRGQARKVGKFVNGHDARDGRWDGRGPRSRVGTYRVYVPYVRRNRVWLKRHKGKKDHRIYRYRRF
jgi:hypothetical protein